MPFHDALHLSPNTNKTPTTYKYYPKNQNQHTQQKWKRYIYTHFLVLTVLHPGYLVIFCLSLLIDWGISFIIWVFNDKPLFEYIFFWSEPEFNICYYFFMFCLLHICLSPLMLLIRVFSLIEGRPLWSLWPLPLLLVYVWIRILLGLLVIACLTGFLLVEYRFRVGYLIQIVLGWDLFLFGSNCFNLLKYVFHFFKTYITKTVFKAICKTWYFVSALITIIHYYFTHLIFTSCIIEYYPYINII